jgi:alpha-2-macroglobulin
MWQECRRGGFVLFTFLFLASTSITNGVELDAPRCLRQPEEGAMFTSDNFPSSYEKNTNCTYKMKAAEGRHVQLTFFVFDTESNTYCSYDAVTVFDSDGTILHKYCGKNTQNLQVISTSNELSFDFKTDGVQEMMGFLASWQQVDDNPETADKEGKYFITFPRSFIENSPEKICIKLFDSVKTGGTIVTQVFINDEQKKNNWKFDGKAAETKRIGIKSGEKIKCFDFTLPITTASRGLLHIKVVLDDSTHLVDSFKEITILKKEIYPLIQTDKGHYKAKEDVKFRILLLDHNLKPSEVETIDELWIEDPRNRRIDQWTNLGLEKGIMQEVFKLSEEPELGTWTINFKAGQLKEKATFMVSEYVLPKFEVSIEPPAAILRDAEEANWKVCAKYTHGGSVKGQMKAYFTSKWIKRRSWKREYIVRSFNFTEDVSADNDCATVTLTSMQIQNLTERVDKFYLNIEYEEEGTGTTKTSKWSGSLVDEAINLEIGSSSRQFILGGFPYVGEFDVTDHDGTPIEEDIEVCVRLFKDSSEIRNKFRNRNIYSMEEDEIAELGAKMADIQYSSNCYQLKSEKGKIQFYVPMNNIPNDVKILNIKATAINHLANETTKMKQPIRKIDVSLTHTNVDLSISIKEKQRSKISCGEDFKTIVYFASQPDKEFDLHYQVISKGMIYKSDRAHITTSQTNNIKSIVGELMELSASKNNNEKENNRGKVVNEKEIILPIDYEVSPSMKLIVFVNDGNETLTDSHTYDVEACQNHKVEAKWNEEKVSPGSPVKLSVSAAPDSLCAISATDKSVELLGNTNKVTRETIGKLQAELGDRKTSRVENYWEYQRRCPHTYNAIKVYESTGIQVLTDQSFNSCETIVEAKETMNEPRPEIANGIPMSSYDEDEEDGMQAHSMSGSGSDFRRERPIWKYKSHGGGSGRYRAKYPEQPKVQLRNYFPENWLFEMINVGNYKTDIERTAPHTMTTWIGEAICMNSQSGLGVSNPSSLLVSQDFFAEIRLPYSVKRGEVFPLNVTVFNYIDTELPIQVKLLTPAKEVQSDQSEFNVCIGPKDNQVITMKAAAQKIGEVSVRVEARITKGIKNCKDVGAGAGYTDALVRPLRVKPEGVPVEIVESDFKCFERNNRNNKFRMSPLKVPSDAVPDSARAWMYVTGDIMAPALENVGNLVRLPTGCGEQNMVGLVPNIYLLQYLNSTNQHKPDLQRKAKQFMEIGYNRQQKYRHDNGAYSIWGDKGDKDGSTWLTAFVVKSFSEAAGYIHVDKEALQGSVDWLMEGQMDDGCFIKRGYVYSSYLKGGGSDSSLTPFVMTALIEAKTRIGVKIMPSKLVAGLDCMMRNTNTSDIYTSIVTAYAAALLNSKLKSQSEDRMKTLDITEITEEKIGNLMEGIMAEANTSEPGTRYWDTTQHKLSRSGYHYTSSKAVEMTAYTVLSLVLRDEVPKALDSVKWLARQRNSQGGFVSTQDTVVALQALSSYAQRVTKIPLNMRVNTYYKEKKKKKQYTMSKPLKNFILSEENALLLQREKLPKLPSKLTIEISGKGCALAQTVLRYNMPEVQEDSSFTITAEGDTATEDPSLSICSSYTGTKESTGMVLIEVELVTGWEAVSPHNLVNEVDSGVQRVEHDHKENKVVLYFDNMPRMKKCVSLELKHVMDIEAAKDALITIYDYYNREDTASTLYNLL